MPHDLPRRVGTLMGELGTAGVSVLRGAAHAAVRRAEESRLAAERATERRRAFERRNRERQQQRRRRARAKRLEATTPLLGWMLVGLAIALFVLGLASRRSGFVFFFAVVPAMHGLRILRHHAGARPKPPPRDRVDEICERLQTTLAELPVQVRAVFGQPERTVDELQRSIRGLSEREARLRGAALELPHEELERTRLATRLEAPLPADEATRERIQHALAALDRRREDASKALALADRMEADRRRLIWLLEGLWLQSVRLAAAGPETSSPDALLDSLRQLRTELDTLADARESGG